MITGLGLIISAIFSACAWIALGQNLEIVPVAVTLFFYLCMAFALSKIGGPKISIKSAIPAAILGLGAFFLVTKDLGLVLFFFSCMALNFSFVFPKKD